MFPKWRTNRYMSSRQRQLDIAVKCFILFAELTGKLSYIKMQIVLLLDTIYSVFKVNLYFNRCQISPTCHHYKSKKQSGKILHYRSHLKMDVSNIYEVNIGK